MHRRQFIAGCSVACAALGASEIPNLMTGSRALVLDAAQTGRGAFDALVGSRFRVYRDARFADTLTLARIADGPSSDRRLEQFTLVFDGAYRPDLATGTYSLVGNDGVSREMHLEPTTERQYRAAFCLLTEATRAS